MKGYSLVEILVTIAILAIGATLMLPGLDKAKAGSQRAACLSNMRQIGLAAMEYHGDRQTILPWYTSTDSYWWKALEPYVGMDGKVFKCPSDKAFVRTEMDRTISYGWNYKLAGHGDSGSNPNDFLRIQSYARPARVLIATDGPGGIKAGQEDSWGYIDERVVHTGDPKRHSGYANSLFLDGHVEAIKTTEFPNNPLYQDRTQHLE